MLASFLTRAGVPACLALGLLLTSPAAQPGRAAIAAEADARHAVILMYHRFGESEFPTTNTTLEQFEAHLAELRQGKYNVLPLPRIVEHLKSGTPLPDRAIAITVDDAFISVYREAWPRLKAEGLPLTLFVATDAIDSGLPGYMSWDQLRELAAAGVTIGSQTASHPHMTTLSAEAIRRELQASNQRFREELGQEPRLFAYPYGEFDRLSRRVVEEEGFMAAFGQHSGVAYTGHDPMWLPRFTFNERYGDLDRFIMAANALPLKLSDLTPEDTQLSRSNNPPAFGFTVAPEMGALGPLACYASGQGQAALEVLGDRRIEVRVAAPFPAGRARINCTLPGPDRRWRWFGIQFYVPAEAGAPGPAEDAD